MAFPTTGILDSFNRPDENPATGWTANPLNITGSQGIKVLTNVARGRVTSDTVPSAYMSPVYAADQEAYAKMPLKPVTGQDFGVIVRIQNPVTASANGYAAVMTSSAGTDTVSIYKIINAVFTSISGPTSLEFADGDQIGIDAVGTTITAYRHNGTSWSSIASVVNGDVTGTGSVGVLVNDNGTIATLDDFGGGAIVTATPNLAPVIYGRGAT